MHSLSWNMEKTAQCTLGARPGAGAPGQRSLRRTSFAGPPGQAPLQGDSTRAHEAIRRAHQEHGYSLSEIGRVVGLHYSTISRIVNVQEDIGAHNKI